MTRNVSEAKLGKIGGQDSVCPVIFFGISAQETAYYTCLQCLYKMHAPQKESFIKHNIS